MADISEDEQWLERMLKFCQEFQDAMDSFQPLADSRVRKSLKDHLAAASSMTKEEREPLMKCFRGILDTRKRFRHPPSAKNGVNKSAETEFTLFPDLPLELRRLIWSYSLPGSRIFEVVQGSVNNLTRTNDARMAHNSVLKVARSCKEAYLCVMERYEKVKLQYLCYSHAVSRFSSVFGQQVYFVDWERDIFYEPEGNMETFFATRYHGSLEDNNYYLMKVKNVALHVPSVSKSRSTADFIPSNMPKINRLIYVADCERRLEEPMIELEESRGDIYPLRLGLPGYQESEPLPLIRTSVEEEDDHPYRQIMDDEFLDMSELFNTRTVRTAYKDIHVSIELWRRAAKE